MMRTMQSSSQQRLAAVAASAVAAEVLPSSGAPCPSAASHPATVRAAALHQVVSLRDVQ